jgi:hypothetical protein
LQGGEDERLHRRLTACEHAERGASGFRNGSVDDVLIDPQRGTLGSVNNAACHARQAQAEEWGFAWSTPRLVEYVETGRERYARCALAGRQPCDMPADKGASTGGAITASLRNYPAR